MASCAFVRWSPATGQDNTQAPPTTRACSTSAIIETAPRELRWRQRISLAIGYIVIDHANYCNLSDPTDPNYYYNDAIGMENNLFGEIIFTSGNGLPTYGISTVNLEADASIGDAAQLFGLQVRSFYARYWDPERCSIPPTACPNCGSGDPDDGPSRQARPGTSDSATSASRSACVGPRAGSTCGFGIITSNFRCGAPARPSTAIATLSRRSSTLTFYDEDEQTTSQGACPSPCTQPDLQLPARDAAAEHHRLLAPVGADAGWVQIDFLNLSGGGTVIDQAWVDYSFEGSIALESVLVPGTQLDPSSCNPEGSSILGLTEPITPVDPGGRRIGSLQLVVLEWAGPKGPAHLFFCR